MKSKVNLISRVLAVVFSLVAIVSFAMPYIVFPFKDSGFGVMVGLFVAHNPYIHGIYGAAFFAGLTFISSLISLILRWWFKFKSRGIGTTVCSFIGLVSIIVFAIQMSNRTAPSWHSQVGKSYILGAGIYIYIVAIVFVLISAIICLVTYQSENSELTTKNPAPYNLNSLSIK